MVRPAVWSTVLPLALASACRDVEVPAAPPAPTEDLRFDTPEGVGLDPALYTLPDDTPAVRLVIKFNEGTALRMEGGTLRVGARNERNLRALTSRGLAADDVLADRDEIEALLAAHPRVSQVVPMLNLSRDVVDALRAEAEAASGRGFNDLTLYTSAELIPGTTASQVAELLHELNGIASVGVAYVEAPSMLAAIDAPPTTPDFEGEQGYLQAAPSGIDAVYAWLYDGGTGPGRKVIDIEWGWDINHEDLANLYSENGTNEEDTAHGTAVLGILIAPDNGYGVTGIAHDALAGFASVNSLVNVEAVSIAQLVTAPGDVILFEYQDPGPANDTPCTCNKDQCDYIPAEYNLAVFDAISIATAAGRNVVEPAGNGSSNLDDPVYGGLFNRSVRDSGAVLVGASLPNDRLPTCFSNFGSRVDAHGWGEGVATTGWNGNLFQPLVSGVPDPHQAYTDEFGGTSSAAPQVAGAILALQAIADAYSIGTLTPSDMRDLLVSTGTLPAFSPSNIGRLPDLHDAIGQMGGFPQLYGIGTAGVNGVYVVNPFTGLAEPAYTTVDLLFFEVPVQMLFSPPGATAIAYNADEDALYVATGEGDDRLYRLPFHVPFGAEFPEVAGGLAMATNVQAIDFAPDVAASHGFHPGALYAVSIDGFDGCTPNCLFEFAGDLVLPIASLPLNQARGMSFHPYDGSLWILDAGGKKLYTVEADGTTTYQSTVVSSEVDTRSGLDTGFSLAHDVEGQLYVADLAYGVLIQVDPFTGQSWWESPFTRSGIYFAGLDGAW